MIDATTLTPTCRRTTPYGETRGATPAWANDKVFVGGTADPTELVHLGAREYDPATGRFISVDPVRDPADPQRWHGYSYAGNSPVTNSDASGLIYSDFYDTCVSAAACQGEYNAGTYTGEAHISWQESGRPRPWPRRAARARLSL